MTHIDPSLAFMDRTPPQDVEHSLNRLENVFVAVIACDQSGCVTSFNARASAVWGSSLRCGIKVSSVMTHRIGEGTPSSSVVEKALKQVLLLQVPISGIYISLDHGRGSNLIVSIEPLSEDDCLVILAVEVVASSPVDDMPMGFESSPIAMHVCDYDGTVIHANQALLNLLGYERDEYIGLFVGQCYADPAVYAEVQRHIVLGEVLTRFPVSWLAKDGSTRHVCISTSTDASDGTSHRVQFIVDMSVQATLERIMSLREETWLQLLQALPVAIYMTDAEGRIQFFNEASVRFSGRRPEPNEYWCVTWKLRHPDGRPLPHDECPMAIALREQHAIVGAEALAERPDGSVIPFLAYPTPLFDAGGKLVGAVNMLLDVSDQHRAARKLQQLSGTLRDLVQGSALDSNVGPSNDATFSLLVQSVVDYAIYMLDTQGHVANWNAGAERIKGYTAREIVGKHFSCFYTPEDRQAGVPQRGLEIAEREGRYEAEGWCLRKDGTLFWALAIIDPIYDRGQLVGFAKVTRDITERKAAEVALIESERNARGVIDTALDGFIQTDALGTILEWNPMAETIFGWTREDAVGRSMALLLETPSPALNGEKFSSMLGGERLSGTQHLIEATRKNRERMTVELSVSSLMLHSGLVFNVFARDVTDKIAMESHLRQSQKTEAIGQLTGGIAHDFNNLLQGIMGALDLVELGVQEKRLDRLESFIMDAKSCAMRAASLTHRLLAFSRRQPLDPKPILVNPLVMGMEDLLRRTIGEHIQLIFNLSSDLWLALCDPNQLESAVLNLVINARDAMPDDGRLTVTTENIDLDNISARRRGVVAGQYVYMTVKDTGVGMTPSVLEHAFDPFFTTKAMGQGTGLGLSMVYGFAGQSKGYCKISSVLNQGTVVHLYLPRYEGSLVEMSSPVVRIAHNAVEGEVALIVEDEDVVRSVVVHALRELGYSTIEADNGASGLEILKSSQRIDLVISDVGLPALNGRQMMDAARLNRPDLKVLFMTGYADTVATPEGFLEPGMALLTKPFGLNVLKERIRSLMR